MIWEGGHCSRMSSPRRNPLAPATSPSSWDLTTIPSQTGSFRFSARSEAGETLNGGGSLGLQPLSQFDQSGHIG